MLVAFGDAERTARGKAAAFRLVKRVGRRPLDGDQPPLPRQMTVDAWHRVDQRPGIGVARIGEDLLGRALLDHLAAIHDDDARTDAGDDAEIMADENDCGVKIAIELDDQLENLRLNGDVERGGRLVAYSSAGSLENPIASMTRWRMPPENWCG